MSPRSDAARFDRPSSVTAPPPPQVETGVDARAAAHSDTRDKSTEPPQKILTLRIAAMPATPFDGTRLREAIATLGLVFGRYRIFHRLDASGRSVFSLASLQEPGTFDPEAMEGATFRGLAMFAVLPGPWPAARTLDDLLATARALATRLGGQLQDERGSPLTVQRVGELRRDAAEFERSRLRAAVR
jgi:cell division protein ZipA